MEQVRISIRVSSPPLTNVADQRTLTDLYETASWNYNRVPNYPMTSHVHYRMASVEVGFSLKYLMGTKELLHATLKAYIGEIEHAI